MAYIPKEVEWFLAEIVESVQAGSSKSIDLHVPLILIRAKVPEEAFEKAMAQGREREMSYTNTDGDTVTVRFLGLRSLNVVHDPIENGAELLDQVWADATPEQLRGFPVQKGELDVFKPTETVIWPPVPKV